MQSTRAALADPRKVAALLGLKGEAQARGVLVLCPAHGDKDSSLSLTVGRDGTLRVKCFGCELSGNVFSLIAAVHGLDVKHDFRSVLEEACRLATLPAPEFKPYHDELPRLDDATFSELATWLLSLPMHLDVAVYLASKKIATQAHKDGWGGLPPPGRAQVRIVRLAIQRFGVETLVRSGLFVEPDDAGNVPLRFVRPGARVLIPWRNESGLVVSIQRRRIDDREPKYVAPRGRALELPYGVDDAVNADPALPVVFVEGARDVLSLRTRLAAAGRRAVVLGIPGIETWRAAWASYASGRPGYAGLDADTGGDRVSMVLLRDMEAAGATHALRWRPKVAKDWSAEMEAR